MCKALDDIDSGEEMTDHLTDHVPFPGGNITIRIVIQLSVLFPRPPSLVMCMFCPPQFVGDSDPHCSAGQNSALPPCGL